jgi:hypothetical protein
MSTQRTAVKLLLAAVIVEGLVTAYALLNRDPVIVTREIRTYFPMPAEIRYSPAKRAHHLRLKSIHCNDVHPIVLP